MLGKNRNFILFVSAVGLFLLAVYVVFNLPNNLEGLSNFTPSLFVFGIINLNIALLLVLAFLVGRNVVKLIFERKYKILGSRLRLKLVTAFVGLLLVPTIIVFVLSNSLINQSIQGWFGGHVESTIDGAVGIVRFYIKQQHAECEKIANDILSELNKYTLINLESRDVLEGFLSRERRGSKLFALRLYDVNLQLVVGNQHAMSEISDFSLPEIDRIDFANAIKGKQVNSLVEFGASKFIRVYSLAKIDSQNFVLVLDYRIDPELTESLSLVNDSFHKYQQLKLFKGPLKASYLLVLSLLTALILFAAIWAGFYIAKELTVPIQRLAHGMRSFARGNYDVQLRVTGDDEISYLVESFNNMISDISKSRAESEQHRAEVDAVLSKLAVGVITITDDWTIASVNSAARKILNIDSSELISGAKLNQILHVDILSQVSTLLAADSNTDDAREITLKIKDQGEERTVITTSGKIHDSSGNYLGIVLIFDDVSNLLKAQAALAWGEVAQRVAHEIKNPLTPIKLSAQRLQKLAKDSSQSSLINQVCETILSNVFSIKRLADEFARYARMPDVEFQDTDLNLLISNMISEISPNLNGLSLTFIADNSLPHLELDREQFRRAIGNLVDNSLVAVADNLTQIGSVIIRTSYKKSENLAIISIEDNGPGIAESLKEKIFEPYFTTKSEGTGLGLSIVSSIVQEHGGKIELLDNHPTGTKFLLYLPIRHKVFTQRKLSAV